MSDVEKALDLLIHDLRAPLSVAHGYLRLIKEERLDSLEERNRALTKAMDALGRISGMCTDASAFLRAPAQTTVPAPLAPVAGTVDLVCRQLKSRDIPVRVPEPLDAVNWRLGRLSDDLAEALVMVLAAAYQERGGRADNAALDIAVRANELHLRFGTATARDQLTHEPRTPFDAWRGGHGLSLPLACRTIAEAGGSIWQLPAERGAIGVAFPVEVPGR